MNTTLGTSVQYLKGVGPQVAEALTRKGIVTVGDLLFHLPYRYLDRRHLTPIEQLTGGKDRTVVAEIVTCGLAFMGRGRRRIYEIVLSDGTGRMTAKWFHVPKFMLNKFKRGMWLLVSGEVSVYRKEIQFIHPDVQILDASEAPFAEAPGIVPLYPLTEGLSQRLLRRLILNALECLPQLTETLPKSILERQDLLPLSRSLLLIHDPSATENLKALNFFRSPAHKRLIFEEFFYLTLGMTLKRQKYIDQEGIAFKKEGELLKSFLKKLPFQLTGDQKNVLSEISQDMQAPRPMNRLVQGDVGSGKTIVSLIASLIAIQNGYQSVMMAPTEILAEQHFQGASKLFAAVGLPVSLLTGSTLKGEREILLAKLKKGEIPLLIGTHALLEEPVQFEKLGLVVIDEQHRFGVRQRAALRKKGQMPDILVLTATPIPRTLAMTVYGDLDVSAIRELPPGRQAIQTSVVAEKSRQKVYGLVKDAIGRGEQVYVVYPLVEESEKLDLKDATKMFHALSEEFSSARVGLIHGKLEASEKDSIMKDFKAHKLDILVSTTVIEVGVDVPNATVMIVEHAERFGLAQLHQLRGRVGRGEKGSYCVLMVGGGQSEESLARLKVMAKTQDGFEIAEADLAIRGPGEFLGTRQAGLPDFLIANIVRDAPLVSVARQEAERLVADDPTLGKDEHQVLKKVLMEKWQGKLELADVA